MTHGRRARLPVSLDAALSTVDLRHIVVEGEPGAGKSALLQHVAYVLAAAHMAGKEPTGHALDLAALRGDRPLLPVPILLEARALHRRLGEEDGLAGLLAAVAAEIASATGQQPKAEALRAGLISGRYLLLIDSLDEVPSEAGRRRVVELLEGAARSALPSRLVLTTRPSAYLGQVALDRWLPVIRIAPLDAKKVDELVGRWCATRALDGDYRQQLDAALGEAAAKHGGANLTENVLLLTVTLLVYARRERLPDSTAELYDEIIRILFETRKPAQEREGPAAAAPVQPQATSIDREDLELVFEILQRAGGSELPRADVADRLRELRAHRFATVRAADDMLDRLYNDTGLLRFEERRDDGGRHPRFVVRPWHKSFQEYLTACRLAAGTGSVEEETDRLFQPEAGRSPVILDPAWEGVLRFLAGVHAQRGSSRAHAYVQRLHDHATVKAAAVPRERIGRLLGLVAAGLVEYAEAFEGHPLTAVVPGEIAAAFERDGRTWPLADRLLALEALGRLGDGDPRLAEDPWVAIPGGSFEMGGDPEAYQSAPKHNVTLDAFSISWRLVTVQDFRPFVASGYSEARFWTDRRGENDQDAPADWAAQLLHPNRPVVGVSWYAASAFCRWASEQQGLPIDLPTEAQWERAARGESGAPFPWGSEEPGEGDGARANYSFPGAPEGPTPVGAFPTGNRGRVADLAGNVSEWCRDAWREPHEKGWRPMETNPCHIDDESASRVVRVGSWGDHAGDLRYALRVAYRPGDRSQYLGFRVVCGSVRERK